MKVALVGFGAVGRGFADVVLDDTPVEVDVVLVADSDTVTVDDDGLDLEEVKETKKETGDVGDGKPLMAALRETEYDVLVEATPTTLGDAEPAFSHITAAIQNGAHVVTSNKGPVAMRYSELMEAADEEGVEVRMEGAVGGAMPVINTVRESLAGDDVYAARGILNGTCNFILSRMLEEGLSYEHVLGEAQDMGIAETDPTFDVEGIDTALKCVILSNVLFDGESTLDDVDVTGITEITPDALRLADESGHVVKLIGEVTRDELKVEPRLIPKEHSLDVGGTLNVVSFETEFAGEITVSGKGAGDEETASALVSDLTAIARKHGFDGDSDTGGE
ncbi:MAG: homoserine dehydrogenase [Halobacteria archaeon]|nr:homoserine dehydrogenase [Halobacteria archaeon]